MFLPCWERCRPALRTIVLVLRNGSSARDNPLLARVTMNRFWQMYFATGIVKTVEDFGAQGEWPSHPELLDWLATEFVRSGWDVKAMQKLIVTSAAYRQSSRPRRNWFSAILKTGCSPADRASACPRK